MSARACPSELEIDGASVFAPDAELASHLASCDACRERARATDVLLELARELPVDVPDRAHREQVRTALLAGSPVACRPRGYRGVVVPMIVVAAASVVGIFAVRSFQRSRFTPGDIATATHRGVVHAHAGARYSLAALPPDEIVRLSDGVIDVDVQPLRAGERFRVVVGTDEVEVRGTSFEVVAAADHLATVHVVHGRVEVRQHGGQVAVLTAGQSWVVPVEAAVVPVMPVMPVMFTAHSRLSRIDLRGCTAAGSATSPASPASPALSGRRLLSHPSIRLRLAPSPNPLRPSQLWKMPPLKVLLY